MSTSAGLKEMMADVDICHTQDRVAICCVIRRQTGASAAHRIVLQPENENYQAILIEKNSPDFSIAGKVVALMRRF
jgi:hypothetical protein